MFYPTESLRTSSLGGSLSNSSEGQLPRVREEPEYIVVLLGKNKQINMELNGKKITANNKREFSC